MSRLLTYLFGRLPIGWLQLSHSRGRFIAAESGVAFANLLVFMQLGIMGALNNSTIAPYAMLNADIIVSSDAGNTLTDSENIAQVWMYQALAVSGVADATPIYIGNLPFTLSDGTSLSLLVFGLDATKSTFVVPSIEKWMGQLTIENTVLLDQDTRGIPASVVEGIVDGVVYPFEANGQTLVAVATMEVGGGFLADGMLVTSDQSFLRFFPTRSSGAPDHILIHVADGVSAATVAQRLRAALPLQTVKVQTAQEAARADLAFMSTQRPTGIIFGFGVFMGILVGLVIVYQVLS
ncbi:MAG: putative ABC transport system permease protein, partial [Gammaproteobacteria bacterium]